MKRLTVIDGGKIKSARKIERAGVYECPFIGCGSTTFIPVMTGQMYVKDKLVGGSAQQMCAECFRRGTINLM